MTHVNYRFLRQLEQPRLFLMQELVAMEALQKATLLSIDTLSK